MSDKVKYLWLACDEDGELVLFKEKPFRDEWYGFWSKWKSGILNMMGAMKIQVMLIIKGIQ